MTTNQSSCTPGESPTQAQPKKEASQAVALGQKVLRVSSGVFFSDAQILEIEHNGALYRLRQTSLGKLILTK